MAGFDASGSYDLAKLENKYSGFISPTFRIEIGGYEVESSEIPISSLEVEQTTENRSGSCHFSIEAIYDYESGTWMHGFLSKLDIGMQVAVYAGYAAGQTRIFLGFVDRYWLDFSPSNAPCIRISAMDALGMLMSNREKLDFGKRTTKEVVSELVKLCTQEGVAEKCDVGDVPDFESQFIKQSTCSSYEFLCQVAEMCFMNFCVLNGTLLFKNLLENTKPMMELTLSVGLRRFTKSVGFGRSIVGSVTVISNGGPDKKELREIADTPSALAGSGKTAAEKWATLGGSNKDVYLNALRTPAECKAVAQSILDGLNMGFVQAEGECIGLPELTAGRYITISGMDDSVNGDYFVTRAIHSFDAGGYTTRFEMKGARSK